jgi:DNA-binding CsgD family transcriptional regulator
MLDLHHTPQSQTVDLLAALGAHPAASGVPGAGRARGYGGPERRGAASLQARRMAQMLDTLDYGMLLLTNVSQVSQINKAAQRDLDALHPLQVEGGQLRARLAGDATALREALLGAAQRGLRRLLQLGDVRLRISVAVVPLPALGADALPGIAVLLGKRQVCEELTVDWFARSHNLTLAETAVMKGLCADFTPQQIAVRQGVGLATIRTQIGSIRLKTGAGSIRALVRQVALLPPLVSALQAQPLTATQPHAGGGARLGADRSGERVLNA